MAEKRKEENEAGPGSSGSEFKVDLKVDGSSNPTIIGDGATINKHQDNRKTKTTYIKVDFHITDPKPKEFAQKFLKNPNTLEALADISEVYDDVRGRVAPNDDVYQQPVEALQDRIGALEQASGQKLNVSQNVIPQQIVQDIQDAIPPEIRHEDIQDAIPPEIRHEDIQEAIPPKTTNEDIQEAIPPETTNEDIQEAIPPVTTNANIQESIPPETTSHDLKDAVLGAMQVCGENRVHKRQDSNLSRPTLAQKVHDFCEKDELKRKKIKETINAQLNSLSVDLAMNCEICSAETKLRDFLLEDNDTLKVISGIGIYGSILTVMLKYGLQPQLNNQTTFEDLLVRLKKIVEPSIFFPMSLVRRDIETVIRMLSAFAGELKESKFKKATKLIKKIKDDPSKKIVADNLKKYVENQSWIQHFLIITWLKMQVLDLKKPDLLEAFLQVVVHLSKSLNKMDSSYRWKFTITVVDSLVEIARNASDLEDVVSPDTQDTCEIAVKGLSELLPILQKNKLHECVQIFYQRARILVYVENVSIRNHLLEGIFKDLDTSSEEMCRERLKHCKNLPLNEVRPTTLHNGSHARIFSANFAGSDVIAKCYKQTRVELVNKPADPDLMHFKYELESLNHLQNNTRHHPNVIKLIAYDERLKCVILEPVSDGNLLNFLRRRRSDTLAPKIMELLSMAVQIANALEFLERKKIIHLAMQAGNVLLHNNEVVKLTGFQFCRTMEQIQMTGVKRALDKRHFKWMDPQALLYQSVLPETVSWSFGVFLYELFTLGCVPFNQPESRPDDGNFKREPLSAHEARIFVIRGGTLPKEKCIPESIFSIISESCLQRNHSFRASPRELKELLKRELIDDSKIPNKQCPTPPELILEKEDYNPGNYNPGINAYDHDFPYAHLDVLDYSWNKEHGDKEFEEEYVNADPSESEPVLCIIKRQDKDHEYKEIRVVEYMEFKDIKLVEKLQKLDCPELVKVLAVNPFGPDRLEMISESLIQGNVFDAMLQKRELRKHLRTYIRQAGSAVIYLHENGIVHRNLKAENYLMVNEQKIKLGRLGMSMEEVDVNAEYSDPRMDRSKIVPDARRNAPEVLNYGSYSRESDVWSFGIVLWELSKIASSLPGMDLDREDVMPYSALTDSEVSQMVTNKKLMVMNRNPDPYSSLLYDVYKECWRWDAENRPSISTVVITLDLKFKLMASGERRALPPKPPQALGTSRRSTDKNQFVIFGEKELKNILEGKYEPIIKSEKSVNSKRVDSQSNQTEEDFDDDFYDDLGSYSQQNAAECYDDVMSYSQQNAEDFYDDLGSYGPMIESEKSVNSKRVESQGNQNAEDLYEDIGSYGPMRDFNFNRVNSQSNENAEDSYEDLGSYNHDFVSKTVLKPVSCKPCGKLIRFAKMALKCRDCLVVCHTDCKKLVPVPCIPVKRTPNSARKPVGPMIEFKKPVNSKRVDSQSNEDGEELYDDLGSYGPMIEFKKPVNSKRVDSQSNEDGEELYDDLVGEELYDDLGSYGPMIEFEKSVNSKRVDSQSNRNAEELYDDPGSYECFPKRSGPDLSKPDVLQSETKGHYYSPVCDDDVSTLSREDISSLPNKQLAGKPSCPSRESKQERLNRDEGLEEETYEEVVIQKVNNENVDTTGHYYSPVCDDYVPPSSLHIPSMRNKENTKKAVEGPEEEIYGEVEIVNTDETNDTAEHNYPQVLDDEGPILSQGDTLSSTSEQLAGETSDQESVVVIHDNVTDIALNMGNRGHVQSVLSKFYSLDE